MVMPLLEVRGVTFGYGRQPLLYDLHLQVGAGEMLGLLGPNGSGKTTLLRLLSGILSPQQGQVLLEGRDLRQWGRRGTAQRMAVVPQELHMPFAFTVEHMVGLGRTPFVNFFGSQTKQDQVIVQDAMGAAGVVPLAGRVFNELSGGERQRVIVAMALAQEPKVLLLDEPTTHLDIRYQIDVLELIRELNRDRGLTVIAAMHDLNLAARYFPRLVLFQRGIVADAGPAEVLEPGLLRRVYGVNVQVGILRGAEHLSVLPPVGTRAGGSSIVDPDSRRPQGGSSIVDPDGRRPQGSPHIPTQPPPLLGTTVAFPRQLQVHVMAGGGTGELVMRALADAHIPFSAGALNIGDSDHALALRLANEVITEQPYSFISPEVLQQVRTNLMGVGVLIICPAPIGPGNVALLREALVAARRGLPVLLLAPTVEDSVCALGEPVATDDGMLQRTGMAARDYTGGEGVMLVGELLRAGAMVVGSVAEAVEAARKVQTGRIELGPYAPLP